MNDEQIAAAMRFDKAAFERAQQRVKSAPLELTEQDFDQLAIVSPRLETEAYEARRVAQLALVQPVPPAIKTKRMAPESMDEFIERFGTKHVTWKGLMKSTESFVEAIKVLTARAGKLEQANKELQARVLELEAKDAARTVEHVDR